MAWSWIAANYLLFCEFHQAITKYFIAIKQLLILLACLDKSKSSPLSPPAAVTSVGNQSVTCIRALLTLPKRIGQTFCYLILLRLPALCNIGPCINAAPLVPPSHKVAFDS